MNILLTGGAGYIGSHTVIALLNAGFKVVLIDNFCNSSRGVIERLKKLSSTDITCIDGDVCNSDLVESILREFSVDGVIHFAGLKAVGESRTEPLAYYYNNIFGTISLLQAMERCAIKSLVFSSSATVYGNPQYLPYDEAHPLNPINPYGRTKLQVEQILEDIAASDSTWKIAALRYFNPVGAHESGFIGENPNGVPNNLMPFVAQVADGRLRELKIFGGDYSTNDGTGVRDYIHVMDLAEGHVAALNYLSSHVGYDTFNLGTGSGTSVLELISEFQQASGVEIKYQIVGRREGDLAECFADAAKAEKILGWKAKRSLREMCQSSWGWQKYLSKNRNN